MSKLYVLIRNDMPKNYQAVQAGHAVAAFMLDYPDAWLNQTLVYLKVRDEDDLMTWNQRIAERELIKFAVFSEPDMDNQLTAIAILSTEETDAMLNKMKLI